MVAERVLELMDIALSGGEYENISGPAVMAGMDHQLRAGTCHGGRHVDIHVAARILCVRSGGQRLVIGVARHRAGFETRHGAHQRRRGAKRLVHDLHGVGTTRHLNDRYLRMQSMLEMLLELHRIDRRRRDDELQIATLRQQRRQIAEQKVDVETALMRLINHDRVVLH